MREIASDVYSLGPWGRTQTNVYAVASSSAWVLVDTGWAGDAERVYEGAAALFGASRPEAILLTHCHPDHSGAAVQLTRRWDRPAYLHPDELPIALGDFDAMVATAHPLDRWVSLPMMRAMRWRRRAAILARGSLGGARAHPCARDSPSRDCRAGSASRRPSTRRVTCRSSDQKTAS